MNKSESKYNNTRIKMCNALIKLLQTTDFLDITVKNLCLVSNINRTTFYAHYNNLFELLEDTKEYMIKEFFENFNKKNNSKNNLDHDLITKENLLTYLSFIKNNYILYKTYANLSLDFNDDKFFDSLVNNVSKPVAGKISKVSNDIEIKYITKFYLSGINNVIKMWAKRDFKEDEEYITNLLLYLKN